MTAGGVLVTRPLGQERPLVAALEQAGFQAVHAPLIAIEPLPSPDPVQRSLLLDLADTPHVIFVSRNAITHGMAWIEDFWPQLPVGVNWYTVGASSAALLAEHGIRALQPAAEMTSEGLLALPSLQAVADQRVLILKGEGGRSLIRETLAQRGARVRELVVYRRTVPAYAPGEFSARLRDSGCQSILISSGEGLDNMVSLLEPESLAAARQLTLVVPGERVAQAAAAAGFPRVAIADNATDEAMVAAVCALAS